MVESLSSITRTPCFGSLAGSSIVGSASSRTTQFFNVGWPGRSLRSRPETACLGRFGLRLGFVVLNVFDSTCCLFRRRFFFAGCAFCICLLFGMLVLFLVGPVFSCLSSRSPGCGRGDFSCLSSCHPVFGEGEEDLFLFFVPCFLLCEF